MNKASCLFNISFASESIDKNKLLLLLNKFSIYFADIEETLNNYYLSPDYNSRRMFYYASFSGADVADERIILIFKQTLDGDNEEEILFLCSSVIAENPLYYNEIKEPLIYLREMLGHFRQG